MIVTCSSGLVADACLIVLPSKAAVDAGRPLDLDMDSIRLGKMLGGNIADCKVKSLKTLDFTKSPRT